jgi:hypothetical protein
MKILQCWAKFPTALEMSQAFMSGSWRYWSNFLPYQLLLDFVFLCLFKAIFSIISSVSSGYEKLPQGIL